MLGINEAQCKFAPDLSSADIAVVSDHGGPNFQAAFDELESVAARNLALSYAAQKGMGRAALDPATATPLPLNGEGVPLYDLRGGDGQPLASNHPDMRPAHYGIFVKVVRSLV